MEPIGGYFSLEIQRGEEYHKNAIRLNTGRNCLEYILRTKGYKKVYLPYYTCGVILEPFKKLGVEYEFYHVGMELEISEKFTIKEGEALLYVNYYGLKQRYVEELAEKIGDRLIVDNTQAFYAKPLKGIDTFYTCRKFFGVPDGAYLYTDKLLDKEFEQDLSFEYFTFLTKRIDLGAEAGYADYCNLSEHVAGQSIKQMSKLTHCMMQGIEYTRIANQRRANFKKLDELLRVSNNIDLPLDDEAVPMVYPYMSQVKGLREKLIDNKIFVARYWPSVLDCTTKDDIEYLLTTQTQPLPIDQRYNEDDMTFITNIIKDGNA